MSPWIRASIALGTTLLAALAARAGELPPDPIRMLRPGGLVPALVDAAPSCIPPRGPSALGGVIETASSGDLQAAASLLESTLSHDGDEDVSPDTLHLRAVLRMREASRVGTRDALRGAEDALRRGGAPGARACNLIERARVELLLRRVPEARASLERARVVGPVADLPPEVRSTLRFYRAEAAVQAERGSWVAELYEGLAGDAHPKIAFASRLRGADLAADTQEPLEAWKRISALLEQAGTHGIDTTAWAPRAAELATAAERYEEAHGWLARAETLDEVGVLASVRKSDVLLALGRAEAARQVLERVVGGVRSRELRDLAEARLAAGALVEESETKRRARLQRSARSLHPAVALYARAELAHRLVAAGEIDEALDVLVRVGYDRPTARQAPRFQADLDAALEASARGAGEGVCPTIVRRLGGRRTLLLVYASQPDPFLRLGDCYVVLGMPGPALDTYRATARRFGEEVVDALPLRIAQASLKTGELAAVRAALRASRARLEPGAELAWAWRRLEAELALLEGDDARAGDLLAGLVSSASDVPGERARAILELARLARAADRPGRWTAALQRALAETAPDADARMPETVPDGDALVTETALDADALVAETSPDADALVAETVPEADALLTETAPDADALVAETAPDADALLTETAPDADALLTETTPDGDALPTEMVREKDARPTETAQEGDALMAETTTEDHARLAEASLYTADLLRRAGSFEEARALYARAARGLPEGTLRMRAAYLAGRPEATTDSGEPAGPWTRLAAAERRIARLRTRVEPGAGADGP